MLVVGWGGWDLNVLVHASSAWAWSVFAAGRLERKCLSYIVSVYLQIVSCWALTTQASRR